MYPVTYSSPAITEFHPATKYKAWYFSVHQQFTAHWWRHTILVPKYFKTDLASIPQVLQNIIPLVGNHLQAAIVHDLCYRHKIGVSKKDADDMFYAGMRTLGVKWLKAQTMYQAVNWFGASSFKGG
jgi:hypothetical protein